MRRAALVLAACAATLLPGPRPASGRGCPPRLAGAVATVNRLATEAGIEALRRGGNAVDAAVAAALALGVVDSHNSGIGGGCFLLLHRADGAVFALDGRETAPAAATRDMFVREGKAVAALSRTGALAIGVPGSLAAYERALAVGGRRSLAAALERGAVLAEGGFPVGPALAARLADKREDLAAFPATAAVFLTADGEPWAESAHFVQRDLGRTYRAIQRCGTRWFYGGPFARSLEAWMRAHGGVLAAADFARYEVKRRRSVRARYRDVEAIGFPPPSSGGVHVAQILGILERFDLRMQERESPALRLHVVAEAMKLAFADRAHWLGDPDFAAVPRGLCAQGYCEDLAGRIDPARATAVPAHGLPPGAGRDLFGRHTTHVAAADSEGNWVAITTTINTSFGSKVVIPGTGVLMNNQMDDFSAQPGTPNAYGLVGAEANAVGPGKRPLSSMSPTIVLRGGRPFLTLGGAGGPTIITQVLQALVNHVDLGMPLEAALAAPRIHHQWKPDVLRVEEALPGAVRAALRARGHVVEPTSAMGVTQAIRLRPDGTFVAASDPRLPGVAAGRAQTWSP